MSKDVRDAVENHEAVVMKITGLTNLVREVQKERNIYVASLDKIRDDIKDFENIMNEQRAVNDRALLTHRKEILKSLNSTDHTLNELSMDRM